MATALTAAAGARLADSVVAANGCHGRAFDPAILLGRVFQRDDNSLLNAAAAPPIA